MCYFGAPRYTDFKIDLKNQSYYCNLYFAPATPPFLATSRYISLLLLLHRSIFDGLSTLYRILLVSIIYIVYYPVKFK